MIGGVVGCGWGLTRAGLRGMIGAVESANSEAGMFCFSATHNSIRLCAKARGGLCSRSSLPTPAGEDHCGLLRFISPERGKESA
jgi:hypothetical protein